MNEWKIQYLYDGDRFVFVISDTIDAALKEFRKTLPWVPGIAVYAITCTK